MSRRTWDSLDPPLTPWIREAVATKGFEEMTPVQASTIPLFMKHKDVVVEAVTGSGKTLAFLLPVLERLTRREEPIALHHIGALIICPTRELAIQIHSVLNSITAMSPRSTKEADEVARKEREVDEEDSVKTDTNDLEVVNQALLAVSTGRQADEGETTPTCIVEEEREANLSAQLLIGGKTSVQQDIQAFKSKSPSILIGTPGRINDFLNTTSIPKTKELEVLIMDEADRLLDMGFQEVLNNIILKLPKQRRTGLFSATMTDAVSQLIRTGLRNPVKIVVQVKSKTAEDKRTPASLQIGYMVVHPSEKITQTIRLLHYSLQVNKLTKSIIYFPTCAAVDYFSPLLSQLSSLKNFTILPLHGKQAPSTRQKNFKRFISLGSGTPSTLFTTDLAARGLDVPDVDLVIQIDPPQDPSSFTHRCGRAGRAGRPGKAIILLNRGREEEYVPFLQVRKTPLQQIPRLDESNSILPLDSEVLDGGVRKVNERLKALVRKDRDLYERSMKAFVSYVRAYTKHQATFIFRLKNLDLGACAASYGLLRLPSMPELKDNTVNYENEVVEMSTFAYADKTREAARVEAKNKAEVETDKPVGEVVEFPKCRTLENKKGRKNGMNGAKKVVVAWSHKVDARERKEGRREKKKRKREAISVAQKVSNSAATSNVNDASGIDDDGLHDEDDWKEMQKEKKAKKLKSMSGM